MLTLRSADTLGSFKAVLPGKSKALCFQTHRCNWPFLLKFSGLLESQSSRILPRRSRNLQLPLFPTWGCFSWLLYDSLLVHTLRRLGNLTFSSSFACLDIRVCVVMVVHVHACVRACVFVRPFRTSMKMPEAGQAISVALGLGTTETGESRRLVLPWWILSAALDGLNGTETKQNKTKQLNHVLPARGLSTFLWARRTHC